MAVVIIEKGAVMPGLSKSCSASYFRQSRESTFTMRLHAHNGHFSEAVLHNCNHIKHNLGAVHCTGAVQATRINGCNLHLLE